MPPVPFVPPELKRGPFTLGQASALGLSEDQLRGASWRRIDRGVYVWNSIQVENLTRLRAAAHRLPAGGVFAGATAGWLYGLDLEPCGPIEVLVPARSRVTRRSGLSIRRATAFERSIARGLPVTSRIRTVTDLVRAQDPSTRVAILDMALHRRLVAQEHIARWIEKHPRQRGVDITRRALALADSASESPMETRLRLLLVLAGLPRPSVQARIRDESGVFIARADLFYPKHRLVIEYDGAVHRHSLESDNRRQNRLLDAGYRILRFTAGDVLGSPGPVVALVRAALSRSLVDAA